MIEVFGPAEAIENMSSFTDSDKKMAEKIVARINQSLKEESILDKERCQVTILKEEIIPEDHQAGTVGTPLEVNPLVEKYIKITFGKKWDKVQIEESEKEIEITLVSLPLL